MHSSAVFLWCKKLIAGVFIFLNVFGLFWTGLISLEVKEAYASQTTIDDTAHITASLHLHAGSQSVFIDDQTGYKFFVDAPGYCVYRKTTDGGSTWSGTTTIDAQVDCTALSVWYDRWTPGDTGNYIHIVTMDLGSDDLFYNRLDTAGGDTLLKGTSPVDVSTNSGNSIALFAAGANYPAITKGTDGTIYTAVNDTTDSYIVECTTSCDLTTGWTEKGTTPLEALNNYTLLAPLPSGDIMLIEHQIAKDDIGSRIWNNTAETWSASTTIDASASDNTTYDVGMSVAVSSTSPGTLYLAYADHQTLGATNDVRVAKYDGSSWTRGTDVISNSATRAITGVSISLDSANDDVYVAYSARTTAGTANTGNVYWKTATSSIKNWSAEQGPVNSSADNIYGIDMNSASDERLFAIFYDATDFDIYGDTISDIFPGIHASSSGSQTVSAYASSSNVYIGKFLLYNTYKPLDVTGVTISESGTIHGANNIANVKLFYETATSAPYNCVSKSYDGNEAQFGSTDTNGFSGADGTSAFTGSTVNVSTTTALCLYVVMDVLDSTANNATIDISIANPSSDIVVSGSTAGPATAQNISGTTNILNDQPTLMHYHWRNDDQSETLATSKTSGNEDTALGAIALGGVARLRTEVSNEGGSSTPAMQYRLEYGTSTGSCTGVSSWINVGDSGGVFDMYNTTNLTDGTDTTNIATGTGGVSNENTTFLTPNAGVKDTSSQTGNIILSSTQYVELEYSIIASTSAPQGNTYCFRLTDAGNALYGYSVYPEATINADVAVDITSSSQTTSTTTPATNFYVGGAFSIKENVSSRNVTSVTISENGTVNAQTGLDNIKLYYDVDTSFPYDCEGESYVGGATQFGSTDTDGFSDTNGTSTFTGSVAISTTQTMCVYTVFDVTTLAQNGETIDVYINQPSTDVVVSGGGSVSPSSPKVLSGATSIVGPVLTQSHYHWRSDNDTEAAAASLTGGSEDIAIENVAQSTPVRVRVEVSNEGSATSTSMALRLEYGAKITTCSAVGTWTDVGSTGGAWDMYNSSNLTDGSDTTNITESIGGTTDENTTFKTSNAGVKDTSSNVATTTLPDTAFVETEFSIQQTVDAGYDTTYCFRLANSGNSLNAYSVYPELTTSPERDFEIQRDTFTMAGTTQTLTAGVDYIAPSASTSAFIRITNSHYTGAGSTAAGATQNDDDVTVYIQNASNIMTSVTFARAGTATGNTRVSWEIIEFIGEAGSDNEMKVRGQGTATYGINNLYATGTATSSITDDSDVVVFITGQMNPDTAAADYNTGQSTSEWASSYDQPVFRRGESNGDAVIVSYAVVEFTGINWITQRSEHTYTSAGVAETEAITAVNSLTRTFIHTQKRIGTNLPGVDEFGHEVWLSSVGFVSYFLESGATTPSGQTSVAWIMENIQTSAGAMNVQRKNNSSSGGTAPLTISVTLDTELDDITNASLFVNTRAAGTGTNFPRPMVGATIASTTAFELWRSNTGSNMTYRAEVVEWPTAGLSVKQNYYRFYIDDGNLDPVNAWPSSDSESGLGENTALGAGDDPLGEGDHIRIRMTLKTANATMPAGTRAFRLQYGTLVTSCSAISESNWYTVGDSASSTVWRGYDNTSLTDDTLLSGDPPTGGDLNILLSDVAGTYEESNDTSVNTYAVLENEDIEYDWAIEQNGATSETDYCFRMINADGNTLDGYNNYPQLRTASFSPRSQNWRWYDDESSDTPTVALASENVSPVNIANQQAIKLRVSVKEIKNIARDDVRFKLQFSESSSFIAVSDVVATSSCTATSTWCYANGGGTDNQTLQSVLLSDADGCSLGVGNGCGTHNEMPEYKTGHRHEGNATTEYEFTIQSAGPRVNRTYYFRLYDLIQDIPVPENTGETPPSLSTEGASLDFSMSGLNSGTSLEGVTTDISTTPTAINFGTLTLGAEIEGAHRLTIDTNGTDGYQLYMTMTSDLMSYSGATIAGIAGTNASPVAWSTGCDSGALGCFGYHTSDDTLEGGSARFAALDTYSAVSTSTLDEIAHSSQPAVNEATDVVFRILVRGVQDAGVYETNIHYVSVPKF